MANRESWPEAMRQPRMLGTSTNLSWSGEINSQYSNLPELKAPPHNIVDRRYALSTINKEKALAGSFSGHCVDCVVDM